MYFNNHRRVILVLIVAAAVTWGPIIWLVRLRTPSLIIPLGVELLLLETIFFAINDTRRPGGAGQTFVQTIPRLSTDGPDIVIAEAKARYAQHATAEDAIMLAELHAYKGDGPDAEMYAHEALDLLQNAGVRTRSDRTSRESHETAQIALFDARIVQGQFIEAAQGLRPHIDTSLAPNLLIALVSWALYLAEDDASARVMLGHFRIAQDKRTLKKKPIPYAVALRIPPQYALIVAYLRHKLLGVVNANEFLVDRAAFAAWQDELTRNAHNPYGARLQDIVADLDAVLI
jgi:hypothetical protein